KTPRGLKLLRTGPRLIWSAGGRWERFFFLSPFVWTAYAFTVLVWASFFLNSINAAQRVFLVFFSYIALVDCWQTSIMSSSVLRGSTGTGLTRVTRMQNSSRNTLNRWDMAAIGC